MTCGPVREAIGVFQDEPSLGAAVEDLLTSGFDRFDISVRVERRRLGRESGAAAEHAPEHTAKHTAKHTAEWADQPEAPSTAYLENDARTLGAPGCDGMNFSNMVGRRRAKRRVLRVRAGSSFEIRVSTRWS